MQNQRTDPATPARALPPKVPRRNEKKKTLLSSSFLPRTTNSSLTAPTSIFAFKNLPHIVAPQLRDQYALHKQPQERGGVRVVSGARCSADQRGPKHQETLGVVRPEKCLSPAKCYKARPTRSTESFLSTKQNQGLTTFGEQHRAGRRGFARRYWPVHQHTQHRGEEKDRLALKPNVPNSGCLHETRGE